MNKRICEYSSVHGYCLCAGCMRTDLINCGCRDKNNLPIHYWQKERIKKLIKEKHLKEVKYAKHKIQ